jgi:hypothetical protein
MTAITDLTLAELNREIAERMGWRWFCLHGSFGLAAPESCPLVHYPIYTNWVANTPGGFFTQATPIQDEWARDWNRELPAFCSDIDAAFWLLENLTPEDKGTAGRYLAQLADSEHMQPMDWLTTRKGAELPLAIARACLAALREQK